MQIEVNVGHSGLNIIELEQTVKFILEYLQKNDKIGNKETIISLAIVVKKKIQELNKIYRQQDKPTDVLSFGYEDSNDKLEGEIILCLEVIKKNAKKDGIAWKDELIKNIIHGILHIIGYKHGKKMFDCQDKIFNKIK